jgi:hypothetical protein
LSWRDEGFSFFNDINRVQFDGLISRAFIVNGAVGKWYRLPRVQDLFRLAVDVHPEVTLYHMPYYHAGMVMAAGLEAGGDLYCGLISRLVPGTSALCKIVRLTGEGWTGEGCGCALSDTTIPNVIRAVQSTILLNMALSLPRWQSTKAAPAVMCSASHQISHTPPSDVQR